MLQLCLALFRHLLVDVLVSSSYVYSLAAVSKWAMDVEDPLSMASLNIAGHSCKRLNTLRNFLLANFTHLFLAQYHSNMDLELCLPDT
jgi:hypothetical protein